VSSSNPATASAASTGYLAESRRLSTGFLFALPLLLLYELGMLWTGSEIANGAGVLLRLLVHLATPPGYAMAAFNGLVLIAILVAIARTHDRGVSLWRPGLYTAMVLESAVYAVALLFLMGWLPTVIRPVASAVFSTQADGSRAADLVLEILLSLGAGVYEEIFFRLFLLSGLAAILERLRMNAGMARWIGLLLSSLLFSLFHHVGSLGDPWDLGVVILRTSGGVFLGLLYLWRGIGIAIWAHALYDVIMVTLQHHFG